MTGRDKRKEKNPGKKRKKKYETKDANVRFLKCDI